MLVALYRSGPLRQRLAKGYAVVGRSGDHDRSKVAAPIAESLLSRPPRLPRLPTGVPVMLRGGPRSPAALWFDTGRVVLHDPATRSAVGSALAEAVAVVAEQVHRSGGLLMPSGWTPGGGDDPQPGLCADLHALEVVSDVQRELVSNLLREYSPALIALTGRQLNGISTASARGSARLSRATDQVATRYIASFSPRHLDRVRAGLRRSERLARLDAMDIDPLGESDPDTHGDVTLRLIDAQLTVSSAMSHALLAQAISMRVRDLERDGRRVPASPRQLLERNRSRAVAHGLAAVFDVERRSDGRGRPKGGGRPSSSPGGRDGGTVPVPAGRVVRDMLRELLPYFRQLDATADEVAQIFLGLELTEGSAGSSTAAPHVRNENDLLARWQEWDSEFLSADSLSRCLRSPGWLTEDHVTTANLAVAAGSTAAARVWLGNQLDPDYVALEKQRAQRESDRQKKRQDHGKQQRGGTGRQQPDAALSDRQLLDMLSATLTGEAGPDPASDSVVKALRAYSRSQSALDLTRALRTRNRDEAKALRRLLRPRPADRVRCEGPLSSWDDAPAAQAIRSAADTGSALLHWDLADADRQRVRAGLRALGRPPGGVRHIVLTDTSYSTKSGERRGSVEVLLVAPAHDGARKTTEEVTS